MADFIEIQIRADDSALNNTLNKIPGSLERSGVAAEKRAVTAFGAAGAAAGKAFGAAIESNSGLIAPGLSKGLSSLPAVFGAAAKRSGSVFEAGLGIPSVAAKITVGLGTELQKTQAVFATQGKASGAAFGAGVLPVGQQAVAGIAQPLKALPSFFGVAGKQSGAAFGDGVTTSTAEIPKSIRSQLASAAQGFGVIGKTAASSFASPFLGMGKTIGASIRGEIGSSIKQGIGISIGNKITQSAATGAGAVVGLENLKEFDAASRKASTLTEDIGAMKAGVVALSRELKYNASAADLMNASYDIASSGFSKSADQLKILRASVIGAVGGFSDVNTVADGVTTVLNAFSLSADHAGTVVQKMAGTQNAGKLVTDDYAKGIGKVASMLALVGGKENAIKLLDEFNGLLAVATAKGVRVRSAMDGIREAYSHVLAGGKKTREAAEELGIDISQSAIKKGGLTGIIQQLGDSEKVQAALKQVTAAAKEGEQALTAMAEKPSVSIKSLIDIFGTVQGVAAIAPSVGKTGQADYQKQLGVIAGTDPLDAYNKVAGGIAKQEQAITNSLKNLDVQIKQGAFGNAITQVMGGAVKALTGLTDQFERVNAWYGTLDPGTKKLVDTFGTGVAVFGATAIALTGVGVAIGLIGPPLIAGVGLVGAFAVGMGSVAIAAAPVAVPIVAAGAAVYGLAKAFGATDTSAFRAALVAAGAGIAVVFGPAAIGAVATGTAALVTGFGSISIAAGAAMLPLLPWVAAAAGVAAGLYLLGKALGINREKLIEWSSVVGQSAAAAWGSLRNFLSSAIGWGQAIGAPFVAAGKWFYDLNVAAGRYLGAVLRIMYSWQSQAGQAIANFANSGTNSILAWGQKFVEIHVWAWKSVAQLTGQGVAAAGQSINKMGDSLKPLNSNFELTGKWTKWLWDVTNTNFTLMIKGADWLRDAVGKSFIWLTDKAKELVSGIAQIPKGIQQAADAIGGFGGGNKQEQSAGANGGVASPISNKTLGQFYGYQPNDTARFLGRGGAHKGIDLAAPAGTPVNAAFDGVARLQRNVGWGKGGYVSQAKVVLEGLTADGKKIEAAYFHLGADSARYFKNGFSMKVKAGQPIGVVGKDGNVPTSIGEHLDLKTRIDGRLLEPREALRRIGSPSRSVQNISYKANDSQGVGLNATTYYPGKDPGKVTKGIKGIEGPELDVRGRKLTRNDLAVAIPAQSNNAKLPNKLPYGTMIRVTNPATGQSVNAEVRDGGPFFPGRELDVTEAVAKAIKFNGKGQLQIKIISLPKGADPSKAYSIGEASKDGSTKNIRPGKQIRLNTASDKFIQASANDEILLAYGGVVSDSPQGLLATKPKNLREQDRVDDSIKSQERAKRDISEIEKELTEAKNKPYRNIERHRSAYQNKVKKLETKLRNAQERLADAQEREKRARRDLSRASSPSSKKAQQMADAEKTVSLEAVESNSKTIISDAKASIAQIESAVGEGNLSTEQGEAQKRAVMADRTTQLNALLPRVQGLLKKYSDPKSQQKLAAVRSVIAAKSGEGVRLKNKSDAGDIKGAIEEITLNSNAAIDRIENIVSGDPNKKTWGETEKVRILTEKAKKLKALLPQLNNLLKKKPSGADYAELKGIQSDVVRASTMANDAQTALAQTKDPAGKLRDRFDARMAKNAKADQAIDITATPTAGLAPKITPEGAKDVKSANALQTSNDLAGLKKEAEILLKTLKDPKARQEVEDLISRINDQRLAAIKGRSESSIGQVGQRVKDLIGLNDDRSLGIDRQVAIKATTPEQGVEQKATNLRSLSTELDSIQSSVNRLMATFKDKGSQDALNQITKTITTQGLAAATAAEEVLKAKQSYNAESIDLLIKEPIKTADARRAEIANAQKEGMPDREAQSRLLEVQEALNVTMQGLRAFLERYGASVDPKDTEGRKKFEELTALLASTKADTEGARREETGRVLIDLTQELESVDRRGERATQEVKNNASLNPESTNDLQMERDLLAIRVATADQLSGMLIQLEYWRNIQTDPVIVKQADELLAKYKQQNLEVAEAAKAASDAGKTGAVLRESAQSLFATWRNGFRDFNSVLDTALNKIADIGMNAIFGQIAGGGGFFGDIFKFLGFKDGGTIKGYAGGGTIQGGAFGAVAAMSAALKKEGPNAVPIVATPGEEMLNLKEAPIYRSMVADGTWDKMMKVYGRAAGGPIGNVARAAAPRSVSSFAESGSRSASVVVDRINSVDYVSVDQLRGILDVQLPATARAGAALVDRNMQKTSWRQRNGI